MPVTVRPSTKHAESWGKGEQPPEIDVKFTHATSPEQLLSSTTSNDGDRQSVYHPEVRPGRGRGPSPPNRTDITTTTTSKYPNHQPPQLIQTSFTSLTHTTSTIFASKNGFLHACIEAYNQHHNLIIRPEDVWFAILTQLSAYINAHASSLQSHFVNHPSTSIKELHIETSLHAPNFDHGAIAYQMTSLMADNLLDPSLRDWILPTFTTTDKTDQAVASIIFMGSLQKYFTYSWGTRCGIPSVTLLGEVDDWIDIAQRCASHLATGKFGAEPAIWYTKILRPILNGFIESFTGGAERFWQGIVDRHVPDGSGRVTYSGWITGFCYWDEKGGCLHERGGGGRVELSRGEIPMGFVKVGVTLWDDGVRIPAEMVAGSVGIRVLKGEGRRREGVVEGGEGGVGYGGLLSSSPKELTSGGGGVNRSGSWHRWEGYDTIQPESGWFMYRV